MAFKVTISGSYTKHLARVIEARQQFLQMGFDVLRPGTDQILSSDSRIVRLQGDPDDSKRIQQKQLQAIEQSDLLYVVNPGGYVGSASTGEVSWAKSKGIVVVTMETAFEEWVANMTDKVGSPHLAHTFLKEQQR